MSSGMGGAQILALALGYMFAIVIGFSMHEFAHAFSAVKLGDPTPKALGRLTLNPLKHIDIFGLIGFLVVGFGWAKPVEINPFNFKKIRRDTFIVSISGVTVNLLLAFIFSGIYFNQLVTMVSVSGLVWTLALSLYLTFINYNEMWLIFIVMIPFQVLVIFFFMLLMRKRKSTK